VSSSNKTEILSLGCSIIVTNHFVTAGVTDDDADDNDDHDDAHSLTKATNIVSSAPYRDVERQTATDGDRIVSSFFIRASDSTYDASNYSDSDASDDDDGDDEWDAEAASDDESDCWCCDDDESWTSHASTTHCVFVDLDPLKINGLYIPQTSNVPVSSSHCQSLPLELTAEIETESERALKLLNHSWQQWYSDDVKIRPTSRLQHYTKHVCIYSIFTVF